jgi:hypothetical protein
MLINTKTSSYYYSRQHGKRAINMGKWWLAEALKCVRNIKKKSKFLLRPTKIIKR